MLALGLYTVLTLLFAWPVLMNLTQGTPGHFEIDRNQNLWNFWWFKRSLLETFTNPYQSNFLFYPFGVTLYLHTYSPYNLLVGLPLQLLFGLIPAYGLLELSTFILAPYGGYLLTRYLVKDTGAALFGGTVFGFCAYHYKELLVDQINLVSLQWLPFFILFLIKAERATTRRALLINGGLASFFFLLNMMVEFYYATYLVMFAGLWWLWRVTPLCWQAMRAKTNKGRAVQPIRWLTMRIVAILGLAGLIFSPILYATLKAIASGRYKSLENSGTNQIHSADLLNMWLPPSYHPIWGENSGIWKNLKLNSTGTLLGYVVLGLAIYALVKVRGLWFWGVTALFWLILSLGPTLRIDGIETNIPLPYRLLVKLPLFNITRAPERFVVMAVMSLAVLGSYGVERLSHRFPDWRRVGVVTLAIALLYLELTPGFLPLPDKIGPFPFAEVIKANNGQVPADKAILEIPITKHQNYDSPRMLYQIYHGRPIIGGYLSRELRDLYREGDYALFDFIDLWKDEPDIVPRKTAEEWQGLLNYTNMGYLVFYPGDFIRLNDLSAAQNLIERALGKTVPVYQDNFVQVYQIPPTRLEKPVIVLTQGWNNREIIDQKTGQAQRWIAQEAHANIVVGPEVRLEANYNLQLEALSFFKTRRLQIIVNGILLQELTVSVNLETFTIPNLKLKPGDNILSLRPNPADGYSIPAEVIAGSEDTRQLRIALTSLMIEPKQPN